MSIICSKQDARSVHPVTGVILLCLSVLLFCFSFPLGFLYGLIHTLFTRSVNGIGEYCLKIAVSIDQLGNVVMQHQFNMIFIVKGGYKFGNRDETISSVIGKNLKTQTLSGFGRLLAYILDTIEKNHSLNSIDYHVEPGEATYK